jgi:hypothetical protein
VILGRLKGTFKFDLAGGNAAQKKAAWALWAYPWFSGKTLNPKRNIKNTTDEASEGVGEAVSSGVSHQLDTNEPGNFQAPNRSNTGWRVAVPSDAGEAFELEVRPAHSPPRHGESNRGTHNLSFDQFLC